MSVLVGIPTHKRPDLLRKCLESIAAQAGDLPPVRVFVADNDARGREGVRVVEEIAADYRFPISATSVAEPGISAVRNAILDEARGGGDAFIAMIDDDETASPEWLERLVATAVRSGASVVGGPTEPVFEVPPSEVARQFWIPRMHAEGPIEVIQSTANCLVSTRDMFKLNWPKFDQSFGLTGGGDTEWFRRIRLRGATFAWSEKASTQETVPASRTTTRWALTRRFRSANQAVRIERLHGNHKWLVKQATRSAARLLMSPLRIPELFTARRSEVIASWASAAGNLTAIVGIKFREYASRH